jgi:hypothetical protein
MTHNWCLRGEKVDLGVCPNMRTHEDSTLAMRMWRADWYCAFCVQWFSDCMLMFLADQNSAFRSTRGSVGDWWGRSSAWQRVPTSLRTRMQTAQLSLLSSSSTVLYLCARWRPRPVLVSRCRLFVSWERSSRSNLTSRWVSPVACICLCPERNPMILSSQSSSI